MNSPAPREHKPYAVSAEHYILLRQSFKQANPAVITPSSGIPLEEASSLCQSVETMCSGLSIAVLEIFAGKRGAQQIAKWFSSECLMKIKRRADLTRRVLIAKAQNEHQHNPFTQDLTRPKVRRAHAQQINESTIEACVIVEDGYRVRALAFRVQKIRAMWKVVEIEIA